jgi:aryl-alcohol dehydrogenase-like predicted oxidoreductase
MSLKIGYGGGAIADYPWHLDYSKPWSSNDNYSVNECLLSLDSLGIDLIDTAHRYGNGISENMIGDFVRRTQYRGMVITKIELSNRRKMDEDLAVSLTRLHGANVSVLLHNPDFSKEKEVTEGINWLLEILDREEVTRVGISSEPVMELYPIYDRNSHLTIVEVPFSLYDFRAKSEIRHLLSRHDILKIANRVLGGPSMIDRNVNILIKYMIENDSLFDYALIGTINNGHLKKCVEVLDKFNCFIKVRSENNG